MRVSRIILGLAVASSTLVAPLFVRADDADSKSLDILNGSTVVQANNSTSWTVTADMSLMDAPTIVGHLIASGGTGNDIQVLVLTKSDYVNWKNGHTVRPLYNSGQVTAADVRVRLSESGTYCVILSNLFSAFTPKTVEGTLKMTWMPSAAILAQRQAALDAARAVEEARQKAANDAFFWSILLLVLTSAAVGGGVVLMIQQRKKKSEPEKMKTAA
jgi:hypothetical protein